MTLIGINPATEQLQASRKNLDAVLAIKEPVQVEEVTTGVALACLEEIDQMRLGWGHTIKKFLASTCTYGSVIALPFIALAGAIWKYLDSIKRISFLLEAKNAAIATTATGALLAADFAVGKVIGIRPTTALWIGAYDAYRQGAKNLSNQVMDSYTRHEVRIGKEIDGPRRTLKKQLTKVYLGIALELAKRHKEGSLQKEIPVLKEKIPAISNAFSQIGLSKLEIKEILAPLEDTIKLIATASTSESLPSA